MRYYLGPWIWVVPPGDNNADGSWRPPVGCVGTIDLRPIGSQARAGTLGPRPHGLFALPDALPVLGSSYTLLAQGDLREIPESTAMRDAWQSLLGYRPSGATLGDLLFDHLTNGSDPEGASGAAPLMPTANLDLEIHLGGHSRIFHRKHVWGDQFTNRIRDRLHVDFRRRRTERQAEATEWRALSARLTGSWSSIVGSANAVNARHRGKLRAWQARNLTVDQAKTLVDTLAAKLDTQEQRELDFQREKYGLRGDNQWRELVPPEMRSDHPGPLPHGTTLTESFNTADSDTLGPDQTWTEIAADIDIVSNAAKGIVVGSVSKARAEADVSGNDNACQAEVTLTSTNTGRWSSVNCRHSAADDTNYRFRIFGDATSTRGVDLDKVVAGVSTLIGGASSTVSYAAGRILMVRANGSTIDGYYHATPVESVTDTAVASGTRGGIQCRVSGSDTHLWDNWQLSDVAGTIFPELYDQSRFLEAWRKPIGVVAY